jgi:trypsin
MKLIILLALCVLAVSADLNISEEDRNQILLGLGFGSLLKKRVDIEQHIVGGVDANIADFPYQLSLRQNGNHICGASILSGK